MGAIGITGYFCNLIQYRNIGNSLPDSVLETRLAITHYSKQLISPRTEDDYTYSAEKVSRLTHQWDVFMRDPKLKDKLKDYDSHRNLAVYFGLVTGFSAIPIITGSRQLFKK